MFTNWFSQKKSEKVGFEDILYACQNRDHCLLINTLLSTEQQCLIFGTLPMENEEQTINQLLQTNCHDKIIILYGKHNCDTKVEEKYKQLCELGFSHVYIYHGGLFEWLLLQDIYGSEFITTSKVNDILSYRPKPLLKTPRIAF